MRREADPQLLLARVRDLLGSVQGDRIPLGLACQRSSFLLWDSGTGAPLTPLVSWQDRRATEWCRRHASLEPELIARTGLLLSPHYAGPKLASMLGEQPALAARLAAGSALFGTLDSWLAWHLGEGRPHQTDLSMAARTGMLSLATGDWDPLLLDYFGVAREALPHIVASAGHVTRLQGGLLLSASLADQASGALALLDPQADEVLVNFGTGAFVLWPTGKPETRLPGYLTAPLRSDGRSGQAFVLEGTINGAGPSLDDCGPPPTSLPAEDLASTAFALPDRAGIGAPHWRPGLGPAWSSAAAGMAAADQRRVMLEGLLFRVREILDGLGQGRTPARLLVAGGLTHDPALATGLASLLGRPVEVMTEAEATVLGAGRLAAGLAPRLAVNADVIKPSSAGAYLAAKYPRWQAWLGDLLNQPLPFSDSPQ